MSPETLLETAKTVIPGITVSELAIVAAVWLRIYVDHENPTQVVRWARKLLDLNPTTDQLSELRENGASIREIAASTGLSKSTVARALSQAAA